jgi:serine/threonine-protein kinase RsbW
MKPGSCPVPSRICFSREIATTFEAKNGLLQEVTAFLRRSFVTDEIELFRVRLSIDEGLQNAFSHGNEENPGKRIRLVVFHDGACWGVIISDEGSGFAPENLPDPTSPSGLWQEHGRGLMIMCHYMDEVSYYDRGRTLRLVKKTGNDGVATTHEENAHSHQ